MFFILFKHNTAYEMRISDWSSDVCASDLIRLDFLANPADMNVDAALDRPGRSAMRKVEQLLARQNPPRVAAKGQEQIEFCARHRHLDILRIAKLARARIDQPSGEAKGARPAARQCRVIAAPEKRPEARDQHTRIERLGHAVIAEKR